MFILNSCANGVAEHELLKINGYWQIEKVVLPGGEEKEYGLSTTVDYFEIDSLKGFRKKMQPRLDGTFATSDDAISFNVSKRKGDYALVYGSAGESWIEYLKAVNEEKLILVGEDKIMYHYTRFQPVEIK